MGGDSDDDSARKMLGCIAIYMSSLQDYSTSRRGSYTVLRPKAPRSVASSFDAAYKSLPLGVRLKTPDGPDNDTTL